MTKISPFAEVSSVFLGTAGWGRKVGKTEAYRILETYYENGFRWIDTATNYPIDRNPKNYGNTIAWLSEFFPDFPDLKVFVKAGSATNQGDSMQLINVSYIALIFDILTSQLGGCLRGLGIHWDSGNDISDRIALIDFFLQIHHDGHAVGLSGVAIPELYTKSSIATELPWIIQTNFSPVRTKQADIEVAQIRKNFPAAKIYGYNLLGGLASKGLPEAGNRLVNLDRLMNSGARAVKNDILEQVIVRCLSSNVTGLVIGPANSIQCLDWCTNLDRFDFE